MYSIDLKHSRNYPSKLLLFGEYTVLSGSKSLAIPFDDFHLRLSFNGNNNFTGIVHSFFEYLSQLDFSEFNVVFNAEKYIFLFQNGYFFESNIPVGYGVGSSGAVSAAIYDLFFKTPGVLPEAKQLKLLLASIENFFHGKSSGIDPLIIYLNEAIVSLPNGKVEKVNFNSSLFGNIKTLLLDSGSARSTSKYVGIYQEKIKDADFLKELIDPLKALNNQIIDGFIENTAFSNLFNLLKKVSTIQFHAFPEMIPDSILPLWKKSLQEEDHLIKLCGAGGGGFFFLFSKNPSSFLEVFPEIKVIHTRF